MVVMSKGHQVHAAVLQGVRGFKLEFAVKLRSETNLLNLCAPAMCKRPPLPPCGPYLYPLMDQGPHPLLPHWPIALEVILGRLPPTHPPVLARRSPTPSPSSGSRRSGGRPSTSPPWPPPARRWVVVGGGKGPVACMCVRPGAVAFLQRGGAAGATAPGRARAPASPALHCTPTGLGRVR